VLLKDSCKDILEGKLDKSPSFSNENVSENDYIKKSLNIINVLKNVY